MSPNIRLANNVIFIVIFILSDEFQATAWIACFHSASCSSRCITTEELGELSIHLLVEVCVQNVILVEVEVTTSGALAAYNGEV